MYPTTAEIRLLEPDLSDVSRYPTPVIDIRRAAAIARIEQICERAFVPTSRTDSLRCDADGSVRLQRGTVHHIVQSITTCTITPAANGTPTSIPPTELHVLADGELIRGSNGTWPSSWPGGWIQALSGHWPPLAEIEITYVHGLTVCPADIAEVVATLTRIKAQKPKSVVPDRAERFLVGGDGRTFFLAQPGVKKLGMPDLDAILEAYTLAHGLA